jgi:hypothetical protein
MNLVRVIFYRLLLKINLHPVQYIKHKNGSGIIFFSPPKVIFTNLNGLFSYEKLLKGYNPYSEKYFFFDDESPNWHRNYYNNRESIYKNYDWWKISDFDSDLGDIKNVWALSRFDWVVQLSSLAATGHPKAIDLLNFRLNCWLRDNPPYKGVNWKCGQEASIRVMHLIFAAILLGQIDYPSKQLICLIEMHIKRIAPTISYAIAQNNNHGTSEAAALFIGGHFLTTHGLRKYHKLEKIGRYWLNNRGTVLFSDDGCFSQYSINYHRFALDTYSFCEVYRRLHGLKIFSKKLVTKIQKASQWLEVLTNALTGDAPNIGANDGALLFPVFDFNFRDFRHSVQWANLAFNNRIIYNLTENQQELFKVLGLKISDAKIDKPIDDILIKGEGDGFFIYKNKSLLLVFRRPIFKFRPSHSDALHIDLWINGHNLFRDGGSFSYFTLPEKYNYYTGTLSHNTIIFDGVSQMPMISKFLFDSWLKENKFHISKKLGKLEVSSGYVNKFGAYHNRNIIISDSSIKIIDNIGGSYKCALLKWRFLPESWDYIQNHESDKIIFNYNKKTITGNFRKYRCFESRLYNYEEEINCLEVEMNSFKTVSTIVTYI